MRLLIKMFHFVLIMTLLLTTQVKAFSPLLNNGEIAFLTMEDDLIGIWAYTVENAEPDYRKDTLVIAKGKEKYKVEVHLTYGMVPGENAGSMVIKSLSM